MAITDYIPLIKQPLQEWYKKLRGSSYGEDARTVGQFVAEKMPEQKPMIPMLDPNNPEDVYKAAKMGGMSVDEVNAISQSAENMAMNFGPGAMGTIVGKGAKGWAGLTGKFSNRLDKMERAEISDVGANLKVGRGYTDSTLGEIIGHNKLFDEYPQLKKISASMNIDPN